MSPPLVLLLVAALAPAADPIRVTTVDGVVLRGDAVSLASPTELAVTQSSSPVGRSALESVVAVEFGRASAEDAPVEATLISGDRLLGEIASGAEDTVRFATRSFGTLSLPLDALRSLVYAANLREVREKPVLKGVEGQDVLYRRARTGVDQVRGTIESIDRGVVRMESAIGTLPIVASETVAVFFGSPERYQEPATLLATATGVDGSRLTGTLVRLDGQVFRLKTTVGLEVEAPLAGLATLEFKNGRFLYVSDLTPASVTERSYLPGSLVWGWRKDRTTDGRPLTLKGTVYPRGLGTHAWCELVYPLDGRFQAFTALVGVDDEVRHLRARGSVKFKVMVDGQVRWESDVLRGLTEPVRVPPVSIQGARELRLITDFADDSGAGDRGDWAMAMLVRPASK